MAKMEEEVSENLFEREGGLPSMGFGGRDPQTGAITRKPVGTKYVGVVTKLPSMVQSRDYDSKKPQFWKIGEKGAKTTEPNDNPVMSVVLAVKCIGSTESTMTHKGAVLPVVGTEMSIWAEKPSSLFYAIGDAITAAGVKAIELGGTIEVEVIGFKQGENKQRMPATQFAVKYSAPNPFQQEASPTVVAAAGPVVQAASPVLPVVSPVQPVLTPVAPVLVEGFTKEQWIAAGATQAHFEADPKFAPFLPVLAPLATPVMAAAVDDAAARRAAALAALSPEDRAALER